LSLVGIVANPASGKDIRRVVSQATTVNNHQKVSIVRRLLVSLYASGVRHVHIMPDHFGIGSRALDGLRDRPQILAGTSFIDMPVVGAMDDSLRAAQYMQDAGAGCIIVLGGDGTCRVVAKGCGSVPLLPISTGTNNVVPYFIEGTVAGLAAAYVALHPRTKRERFCYQHKKLVIYVNGEKIDQALVDIALLSTQFTGAKAVWEAESLCQIFVSRAQPFNIGISSVIGMIRPIERAHPGGATVTISANGQQVLSPIAPGTFVPVGIGSIFDMEPGTDYPIVDKRPAVLSLDGEREIRLRRGERASVRLELDGPWIVDVEQALLLAVEERTFEVDSDALGHEEEQTDGN
jgi:predicted polyphosphate/ATP-dependent NAD kinase